jgi:hypothetical protein
MDCHAIEQAAPQRSFEVLRLAAGWFARLFRGDCSMPRIDLEATPDRIKRDLGFLDGREPHYEEEGRRR